MTDDKEKKGGVFGLGADANDNAQPPAVEAELDEIPAKSSRRLKLEVSDRLADQRSEHNEDILLSIIPEDLRLDMEKLSRGFNTVIDECVEIFVHLGEEGVQLVSNLRFLHELPRISMVKQDLILLKTFLIKFKDQCADYGVDPIPLLMKLVRSRPGLTMLELFEVALGLVMRMINMAFPAKLQKQLVDMDWEVSELGVFIQNWEMLNRISRYEGFQYAERYVKSAEEADSRKGILYQ